MSKPEEKKGKTFNEILVELNKRCFVDPEFKKEYLKNPKGVIEKTLNIKLPSDFEVAIHENTPKKLNIALGIDPNSLELTDEQLEMVSGGFLASLITTIPAIITASATLAGVIATSVLQAQQQNRT